MLEATFYNQLICIKNVANVTCSIVEDVVIVKNEASPSTRELRKLQDSTKSNEVQLDLMSKFDQMVVVVTFLSHVTKTKEIMCT